MLKEVQIIQILLAFILSLVGCGRAQESSSLDSAETPAGEQAAAFRDEETAEDQAQLAEVDEDERIVTIHVQGGAKGEGCDVWDLDFYSNRELGVVTLFKYRALEDRKQGDSVTQNARAVRAHLTLVGGRDVIKLRVPDGSAVNVSGRVSACDGSQSTLTFGQVKADGKRKLTTVWSAPEADKKSATLRLSAKVSKTKSEEKLDKRQDRFEDKQDRKEAKQERKDAKQAKKAAKQGK